MPFKQNRISIKDYNKTVKFVEPVPSEIKIAKCIIISVSILCLLAGLSCAILGIIVTKHELLIPTTTKSFNISTTDHKIGQYCQYSNQCPEYAFCSGTCQCPLYSP